MKKLWNKMDVITKGGIICFGIYMMIYLVIDIIEVLFEVTI